MRNNWLLSSGSLILSIILHIILGIVLAFSFKFTSEPPPPPTPEVPLIQATVIDKKAVDKELKRIKDKKQKKIDDELNRKKDLEKEKKKKRDEIKKKKSAAKKKIEDEKIRLKKLEQKKIEKKELEKKKKLEEEKKKLDTENKKKDEQQKTLDEEKRKIKEEADRLAREKAINDAIQQEIDDEIEAIKTAEQQKYDLSIIARFQQRIRRQLESKFNKIGLDKGLSCVILIRMIEGGKVVEASIAKSSGNALFDQRAENAVYLASPLPVPEEIRVFEKMRSIRFTFEP